MQNLKPLADAGDKKRQGQGYPAHDLGLPYRTLQGHQPPKDDPTGGVGGDHKVVYGKDGLARDDLRYKNL